METDDDNEFIEEMEIQIHKLSTHIRNKLEFVKNISKNYKKVSPPLKIQVEQYNNSNYFIGISAKRMSISEYGNSIIAVEANGIIFEYKSNEFKFIKTEKITISELINNIQIDAKSRIFLVLSIWKLIDKIIKRYKNQDFFFMMDIPPYISPNLLRLVKFNLEENLRCYMEDLQNLSEKIENLNLCLISKNFRASFTNFKSLEENKQQWLSISEKIGSNYEGYFLKNYLNKIGDRTPFFCFDNNINEYKPNFGEKGFIFCYFLGPNNKIYQFEMPARYGNVSVASDLLNKLFFCLINSPFDLPLPLITAKKQISSKFLNNYLNIIAKATGFKE